jgi:hypothetical protein
MRLYEKPSVKQSPEAILFVQAGLAHYEADLEGYVLSDSGRAFVNLAIVTGVVQKTWSMTLPIISADEPRSDE